MALFLNTMFLSSLQFRKEKKKRATGKENFLLKLKGAKVKNSHGEEHRTKTDAKNIVLSPADSIFAK